MCDTRLLEAFERVPALLRPLEPTQLLLLQQSQRALQRLLPQDLVQLTAKERFFSGHFQSPWLPGTRMVSALNRCDAEDVDACFAMLAAHRKPEDGALHMAAVRNFLQTLRTRDLKP